jgi:hypothetical protein
MSIPANSTTRRTLRLLNATIIVNLLLWMALFGCVMRPEADMIKPLVIAGVVCAALAQHWAYYAARRAVACAEAGGGTRP